MKSTWKICVNAGTVY